MSELVHLRLDSKMRKKIKNIININLFSNESEFIRDSIRKNIETYEKIALLKEFKNSVPKNKNKPKQNSLDIFREFGIE